MHSNDLEKFAEIMTALNEVYGDPGKPLSPLRMDLYFASLQDLSIEELRQAIGTLAATKTIKTFPLPAEIREAAKGKAEDRALLAFEDLIEGIQTGGYYNSVIFEDGCIVKCIEAMGGWNQVCDWTTSDREWHRKEFVKLYRAYEARGPWQPSKVIGAYEHHNALKGYKEAIPEPIRIGKSQVKELPNNVRPLKGLKG